MADRTARHLFLLALPLALALGACGGDNDQTEPEVAARQVAPDQGQRHPADPRGASDLGDQADDGITRYNCQGGWTVEVDGEAAHVSAMDGRVVQLPVSDRSPPLYAGEGLEFSVGDNGATLVQDAGQPLPCERS